MFILTDYPVKEYYAKKINKNMKITKDQILENLDQVKKYISEIDNKPKIEKGTLYCFIDEVNKKQLSLWENDNIDNKRLKNHNVYLTEAECDKQIAKNKALNKIKTYIKDNFEEFVPDWEDEMEYKYNLYYDYVVKEWYIYDNRYCRKLHLLPYLKSIEQAEQVIKDCEKELDILIK